MAKGWMRCAYALLAVFCMAVGYQLTAHTTEAWNDWPDSWRKWPWRAGTDHQLLTLPRQGSHAPPQNPPGVYQEAIDVAMADRSPVHAVAKSTVVWYREYGSGGWILLTKEADTDPVTYISYMHLDDAFFQVEYTPLVQGQYIALSGDTGTPEVYHLHFERSYDKLVGTRRPAPLAPISGTTSFALISYQSDNAGIGDMCAPGGQCTESSPIGSTHYATFTAAYNRNGGYAWGPGVTWDPCGGGWCWWVHSWGNGVTGLPGVIQDFKGNTWIGPGAIMRSKLTPYYFAENAYWITGAAWQKYVDLGGGPDSPLGYPVDDPDSGTSGATGWDYFLNHFEGGFIIQRFDWVSPPYETHGSIMLAYFYTGGPTWSACGLPESDAVYSPEGYGMQSFELGYMLAVPGGVYILCD